MKHFHINDRKKALAVEIFNETQLLLEQQKTRDELIQAIVNSNSYTKIQELEKQLRALSKDIEKKETIIHGLQVEHDLYIEKP